MKGEWDCESMRERAELSASEFEKKERAWSRKENRTRIYRVEREDWERGIERKEW